MFKIKDLFYNKYVNVNLTILYATLYAQNVLKGYYAITIIFLKYKDN